MGNESEKAKWQLMSFVLTVIILGWCTWLTSNTLAYDKARIEGDKELTSCIQKIQLETISRLARIEAMLDNSYGNGKKWTN